MDPQTIAWLSPGSEPRMASSQSTDFCPLSPQGPGQAGDTAVSGQELSCHRSGLQPHPGNPDLGVGSWGSESGGRSPGRWHSAQGQPPWLIGSLRAPWG